MRLGELLDARRVVVPLGAATLREATRQLADALVASGAVADTARFEEVLRDDWPEDVVSLADRAFLPHFRTEAVRGIAVALGVTPEPLSRGNDPHRGARVVVLIVAPAAESAAYLRAMAAVATALSSDEVLEGLHHAASPEEVLAIGALAETPVPPDVTVRDVMSAGVATVGPDVALREAANLMLARGVRALPVVGPHGEVLGLLTDGHLLTHLLPATVSALSTGQTRAVKRRGKAARPAPVDPGDVPVREVMDRAVMCLADDQTVADAAALMLTKDVDRFPVTRDGTLVGFVTRGDIVRKLLRP